MVSRSEIEYSFEERTRKVQTQTCVCRHCDISRVQSNEDSLLFFLMVQINMLLPDIIVYDAYSCLTFMTNTDINFRSTFFDIYATFFKLKALPFVQTIYTLHNFRNRL